MIFVFVYLLDQRVRKLLLTVDALVLGKLFTLYFSTNLFLNSYGFRSIVQTIHILLKIIDSLVDTCNHNVVSESAQVLLQQSGQLRVAIRNVRIILVETFDAVSQG